MVYNKKPFQTHALPISWPPPNPTTGRKKPTAHSSTKQTYSACAIIKQLRGYFIYNHTVQVVDKDVNQKEHDDERVQQ